jgi:hypothetical protein
MTINVFEEILVWLNVPFCFIGPFFVGACYDTIGKESDLQLM